MAKKISKTEIKSALNTLNGTLDYAEELAVQDGYRESRAFLAFGDTVRRCSNAISLLERAGTALPEKIAANRGYYAALNWCRAR